MKGNTTNIYKDGSKMDERVGAAVCCNELEIHSSLRLPDHYRIYQAEVFEIKKAPEVIHEISLPSELINIYVDIQAVIKGLLLYKTISITVAHCKEAIRRLAASKTAHLYWVLAYTGVEGNERANELVTDEPIAFQ